MEMQNTILIVDDEELNRLLLCQLFEGKYTVLQAGNGKEALNALRMHGNEIAIVLLDIVMPVLDGFGFLESMHNSGLLGQIPVVLITGDSSLNSAKRGYEYGTADIITKPFEPDIVKRRVENVIDLYQHKSRLEHLVELQTRKIEEQKMRLKEYDNFLIDTLSTVVEFRNLESGQHINRIRTFTKVLLKYIANNDASLHITPGQIDVISSASALHDVGKIAIPDSILLKPGKLTPEEFEIMKTHTTKGCEILESMRYIHPKEFYKISYEICRSHHERWDGRGYPDGLKEDEIPLPAQVVSIADVYDALVSVRCYKKAYTTEQALGMILGGECGTFNPRLMEYLKMAAEEMAEMVNRTDGELAPSGK